MRLLAPVLAFSLVTPIASAQQVSPDARIVGYMQRECSDGKERLLLYSPDDNRVVYEKKGDFYGVEGSDDLILALVREKKLIEAHCHAIPTSVYIADFPGGEKLKGLTEDVIRNKIMRWKPSDVDFTASAAWESVMYASGTDRELRHLLVVVEDGQEPVLVEYGLEKDYQNKLRKTRGKKPETSDAAKAYEKASFFTPKGFLKSDVVETTFEELEKRLRRTGKIFMRRLSY